MAFSMTIKVCTCFDNTLVKCLLNSIHSQAHEWIDTIKKATLIKGLDARYAIENL